MAQPVPEGFGTLTPHITVSPAGDAIEFYKKAFAAEETCRMPGPGGAIMYAELRIGGSMIMLNDEFPPGQSPKTLGGSPVCLHLYVDDVDQAYQRAVDAGATPTMPVMDMFWGDRYGKVQDPFGHEWSIATHQEDLTPEQIGEAAAKFFGGNCG